MPPISTPQSAGNNKQRRTIIIVIVASVLLIVGIVVLAYLLNSGKKATPSNKTASDNSVSSEPEVTPVTADELRESFEKVAKVLIHGSPSTKNLDLSTETSRWSLTIISNSTAERQYNFAESIKKANNTYQEAFEGYLNTHEEIEDLDKLKKYNTLFDERIITSILYLRINHTIDTLHSKVTSSSDELNAIANEELVSGDDLVDELPKLIVKDVHEFYEQDIVHHQILYKIGCTDKKGVIKEVCDDGVPKVDQYANNKELDDSGSRAYTLAKELDACFEATTSQLSELMAEYLSPALEKLNG